MGIDERALFLPGPLNLECTTDLIRRARQKHKDDGLKPTLLTLIDSSVTSLASQDNSLVLVSIYRLPFSGFIQKPFLNKNLIKVWKHDRRKKGKMRKKGFKKM